MLSSVEQAFVGRDEKRAPLKTPAWEANYWGAECESEGHDHIRQKKEANLT